MKTDNEILEGVLAEFSALAQYPRPSHHEKKVSDYLVKRLTELGLKPVQDDVYNVVADQPATAGYEAVPLTIIQGHMDMVCVADEGKAYDPLKDPIILKREGDTLSADGTSLGADDGMAEAISLYLLQQDFSHGPIRYIFTVDEETGMTGAIHLDPKYVQDAKYIINCDSEEFDILTVGSAGSAHMDFTRTVTWQKPHGQAALQLTVAGLLGGHSGATINDGKGNAVKALAVVLQRLYVKGLSYELASFEGGVAANAIPAKADAVIVIDPKDAGTIKDIMAAAQQEFCLQYGDVEKSPAFTAVDAAVPAQVFSQDDAKSLVQLLSILHFGVFKMSPSMPGLPEMSANIGTVKMNGNTLTIQYFPRSSKDACLRELAESMAAMADVAGFALSISGTSPAWTENTHSVLAPLMAGIFKEQNGKDMKVEAIHAGLETGYFFARNPELDIVSVGPTTRDIHSPQEILVLSTVAPLVRLIMETLKRMK